MKVELGGLLLSSTLCLVIHRYTAEEALAALQEMSTQSKVIRGGRLETVASTEFSRGDIILEAGDSVPATAAFLRERFYEGRGVGAHGESVPVEKTKWRPWSC